MGANDTTVLLDLNYPEFQSGLFDLDVSEVKKVFKTLRKLRNMTRDAAYGKNNRNLNPPDWSPPAVR